MTVNQAIKQSCNHASSLELGLKPNPIRNPCSSELLGQSAIRNPLTHHWTKSLSIVIILIFLSGCTFFTRSQPTRTEIHDPLIERERQWSEQVERGNWALQNRELKRAIDAYQMALAIKPNSPEVQLKIGEIHFQQGQYEQARDAFAAYLRLDPKKTSVWNYLGFVHEKLKNYDAAAEAYQQTVKREPQNLYALNHLGLAYKQLQRLDDAEKTLRKALEIDPKCRRPESQNLHNYLALIYLERGEVGEAIAEFRESARLFPQEVWPRQQLATVYENNGRYYEAQLQYQNILKIDPQNLLAPARLQALSQVNVAAPTTADVSPVDLVEVDINAIIADAPDASDYPDADVVILLNQFTHDVLPTGQSRYTTHQVVKLLTERGVQKYDDIAIPYQPTAQRIGVNIARTILPDGTSVEPPDEAYNDVTPPGLLSYNLYSDSLWKVISMPALTPGVCVEYQVTMEDASVGVVGSETWFWGGFNFQSDAPILLTNYGLRVLKERQFRWRAINFELNPQILHETETSTYLWTSGEMLAIKMEAGMPPFNDVTARISYSSVSSWDDVYKWYKDLAKDRYTVNADIEETVQRLTANLTTEADKIREIYHFVASQIRYVGIELGAGAYQPTPAPEVFSKRYGDCKDKTTLMIAMLDLVGIRAYPVLISPAPYQRIDTEIPSLGQFSHVIVAVAKADGGYIWLDATSDTCSFGDLPDVDQGREGFLIGDEWGEFVETPIFPPESNQLNSYTEMRLNSDESVEGQMRVETKGQYNLDSRQKYKQIPTADLRDTLAAELSKQFPGVSIGQVNISDLQNLNVPVQISVDFRVDDYAKPLGDRLLLPLPIDEFADYAELFAATQRKYPLDLSYPMQMTKEIRIVVPEGWTAELPADIRDEQRFARVERQYQRTENEIRYILRYTLKTPSITPEDYPTAKRFFDRLAREDGARLVLERVKSKA